MIDINNFDIETTVIDKTTREEEIKKCLHVIQVKYKVSSKKNYIHIEYSSKAFPGKMTAVEHIWPDEYPETPEDWTEWHQDNINIAAAILNENGFTVVYAGQRKNQTAYILVKEFKSLKSIRKRIKNKQPRQIIADRCRHLIEVRKLAPVGYHPYEPMPRIRFKSLLNSSQQIFKWDTIKYPDMHTLLLNSMGNYMGYTVLAVGCINENHYIVAVEEEDRVPNINKLQRIKREEDKR